MRYFSHFMFVGSITLLGAVATNKGGCDSDPSTKSTDKVVIKDATGRSNVGTAQKFTFENHDYLLVTFSGEGGGALTHSESCQCRPTPKVEKQP